MKPAGLLLHPTPYLERRRLSEPWAALLLAVLTAAATANWGSRWAKLGAEEQEGPSGGSWMPPKDCIPPVPFVLAGFAKIHCISPCRCPWGEQLPHSGVFFVSPLKYIYVFIAEGRKCLLTFTSLQALWGFDF